MKKLTRDIIRPYFTNIRPDETPVDYFFTKNGEFCSVISISYDNSSSVQNVCRYMFRSSDIPADFDYVFPYAMDSLS